MTVQKDSGFTFLPRGATIQEFNVAGHNIVQSFPHAEQYRDAPYFGETIGRTTNRIKDGKVGQLNGKSLQLAQNNSGNHLHGGTEGWGKKLFAGPHALTRNGRESILFTYQSPDGEEGYPGTVELRVWYTAYELQENDMSKLVLEVEYEAEMVGDECDETIVGITNHSYFNLSESPTVQGTQATLTTIKHLPVDDTSIPTGAIEDFPGLQADKSFTIGAKEPVIDHCFVFDETAPELSPDTRSLPMRRLVEMSHPSTGLHLQISSTEPAFQFYTGDYVDIPASTGSPAKPARAGICVEPSRYINAVNVPGWRNQVLLKRGQTWGSKAMYKAWKV